MTTETYEGLLRCNNCIQQCKMDVPKGTTRHSFCHPTQQSDTGMGDITVPADRPVCPFCGCQELEPDKAYEPQGLGA